MGKFIKLSLAVGLLLLFSSFGWASSSDSVRVLIFSAPFGSGHDTAAKRIKDVLATHYGAQGQEVEIIIKNTLDFAPAWWSAIALKQFSSLQTHMPIVYTHVFENYLRQAHKVENAGEMKLFKQLRINTQAMDSFIHHGAFKDASGGALAPTVVFSTWPGSSEALIYLRNQQKSYYHKLSRSVPLAHVQTDNATHDRYFHLFAQDARGEKGADVVYVPSREVYEEYVRRGMNNVVFTGMPLIMNGNDLPPYDVREIEKRMARSELGLPVEVPTVMIEAGKNGAANYAAIIGSLVAFADGKPLNIIAASGENKKNIEILTMLSKGAKPGSSEYNTLMYELKELYKPRILRKFLRVGWRVFGLNPAVDKDVISKLVETGLPSNVNLLIKGFVPLEPLRAASDIVITKPGGLSTAELGANGRPMIILQETASGEALPNGPLFAKKNLAILNTDISVVGAEVMNLLDDAELMRSMYASSNQFRKDFKLERVLPFVEQATCRKLLSR